MVKYRNYLYGRKNLSSIKYFLIYPGKKNLNKMDGRFVYYAVTDNFRDFE